jgi:branched-chain amino acid transport system ATP-binding protein
VRENLETGTRAAGRGAQIPGQVFDYFPILKERLRQYGGTMSGGEQQMLAIARALCGRPRLLLMDEPSDGVQPSILEMLTNLIPRVVADRDLAVVLVEQNLDFALSIAGRCLVMEKGAIAYTGTPDQFKDPATVAKYLAI